MGDGYADLFEIAAYLQWRPVFFHGQQNGQPDNLRVKPSVAAAPFPSRLRELAGCLVDIACG